MEIPFLQEQREDFKQAENQTVECIRIFPFRLYSEKKGWRKPCCLRTFRFKKKRNTLVLVKSYFFKEKSLACSCSTYFCLKGKKVWKVRSSSNVNYNLSSSRRGAKALVRYQFCIFILLDCYQLGWTSNQGVFWAAWFRLWRNEHLIVVALIGYENKGIVSNTMEPHLSILLKMQKETQVGKNRKESVDLAIVLSEGWTWQHNKRNEKEKWK